jgi:O-antigen/teichoic acid export membrane protein
MKGNVRLRLLHAVGATTLGPIVTAVIQVVSVPVFLHFWGPKLYGEWLVLSAIPIYLGFTEFGFGSVAGNDMTMLVARGEKSAALEVFQSVWALTTIVSLSFASIVALGLWTLPIVSWLKLSILSRGEVSAILSVLCVYVLLDMQWNVVAAGFRCDGNYAFGTLFGNIARFCANAASVVAVALHASPLFAALALVIARVVGNAVGQIVLARMSPWLRYGFRHASIGVIRKLFSPAVAYMALTAGNSFIFQGMTILVSAVLGPIAVVMFTTLRTLTRFAYQMVNVIADSILPELSASFGSGNWPLARKIHRHACQVALALSCVAILFLLIFGGRVYGVWTHHRVAMDHPLFKVLLLEVLANSFWSTSAVVTIACNRHQWQAVIYVAAAALSLPVAYLLMPRLGLVGAGLSLLFADICMIVYVLPNSLALLHDNLKDFALALLRPPSLGASDLKMAE